ncbi:hypothetical protein D9M70_400880 [compost metagenome]
MMVSTPNRPTTDWPTSPPIAKVWPLIVRLATSPRPSGSEIVKMPLTEALPSPARDPLARPASSTCRSLTRMPLGSLLPPSGMIDGLSFGSSVKGRSSVASRAGNSRAVGGNRPMTGPAWPMSALASPKPPPLLWLETTLMLPSGPAATLMPFSPSTATRVSRGISASPMTKVGTFSAAL